MVLRFFTKEKLRSPHRAMPRTIQAVKPRFRVRPLPLEGPFGRSKESPLLGKDLRKEVMEKKPLARPRQDLLLSDQAQGLQKMRIRTSFLPSAAEEETSQDRRLLVGILLEGPLHEGFKALLQVFELLREEKKPGFNPFGLRAGAGEGSGDSSVAHPGSPWRGRGKPRHPWRDPG